MAEHGGGHAETPKAKTGGGGGLFSEVMTGLADFFPTEQVIKPVAVDAMRDIFSTQSKGKKAAKSH